jgi:glycosyltransferase involved in cell wall biosynthesis
MYFSVVIPLFNKERHIGRAIKSVINQTYQKFEIIVIDDGSTDDSVSEVLGIKDSRLRLIRQKNGGVSSARNKGIDEAKFDYIGFLDADDIWKPSFLESIKSLIEKYPQAGAYATAYEIKKEDGAFDESLNYDQFQQKWQGIIDDYFKYAIRAPLISASSVVIPKKVFNKIGQFPIGIKRGEDLDMWCRIALNYDIAYFNEICATYFHDADNRACSRKTNLMNYRINYAEEALLKAKESGNYSNYAEEYMIQSIISKARYLIDEGMLKEARKLLYKYRYTRLNKKLLIKTYIISWVPKSIKPLAYNLKDKLKSIKL